MTRLNKKGRNENLEDKIKELYRKYMKPNETIIVNVCSAMVDIDTCASLQLS